MKKLFTLALATLLTAVSFGQISEGKISYDIEMSSTDAEIASQLPMLAGSKLVVYFMPGFNRTEMNLGTFMTNTTITDAKANAGITLITSMMGNIATQINDLKAPAEGEKPKVVKTTETKVIKGYTCTKYLITVEVEEEESEVAVWVTDAIKMENQGQRMLDMGVKDGAALEFEIDANGMTMKFICTDVSKTIDKKLKKELFSIEIPAGYTLMDESQLKSLGM